MNCKAVVLAFLLTCAFGAGPPGVAAPAAADSREVQQSSGHKWRDVGACALSLFLPRELADVTGRMCTAAILHWID